MKFKMNEIIFEIKEVSQEEYKNIKQEEDKATASEISDISKGIYFGASHYYNDVVYLDIALPKDRKRKTLIHELTHCYISEYITHQENQYTEEDIADISANSHDIIHEIVEKYFKGE